MHHNDSTKPNPYLVVIFAVTCISASAIFVKLATAPPAIIAFYRMFFAVLLLLPAAIKGRKELVKISLKDFWWCLAAGVFLAFHFIFWFQSLNYTSVASSVVLVTLQPLFAFAGAVIIFKERIKLPALIGAMMAILGSVMIGWGDLQVGGLAFYGDMLALLACLLVTVYLMIGQATRQRLSVLTYTFIVYSFSAITLAIFVAFSGHPFYPYGSIDWFMFILLAIMPTLLGHSLLNWAVKFVGVSMISMSILGEPVGAAILAYFVFGEVVGYKQMIGSLIILTGIFIYLQSNRRVRRASKEQLST